MTPYDITKPQLINVIYSPIFFGVASTSLARLAISQCDLTKTFQELLAKLAKKNMMISGS